MYIKVLERETDSFEELLLENGCAVTLGSFDGLHRGHIMLVRGAVKFAKRLACRSCVFSFTSNTGDAPYITSNEQRADVLQTEGVDLFVMRTFADEFKSLSPKDFLNEYILKRLNARAVVVGFNYRFGHKGEGDVEMLRKFCDENEIMMSVIPPVMFENQPISSTRIRNAVEAADFTSTKNMLGRDFSVHGKVIHGEKVGKALGFPTANLEVDINHVMPPKGVYATKTIINGVFYHSITNYGGRPTIKNGIDLVETHILDFEGYIYGTNIEVLFVRKMRDIIKFSSKDELSRQILEDKHKAKEILDKK